MDKRDKREFREFIVMNFAEWLLRRKLKGKRCKAIVKYIRYGKAQN